MATLYIVGTPIGNLEDISKRALRILSEVDLILCEDTRVASKLLERWRIKTATLSYHQYSKLKKTEYVLQLLKEGKNLALVSDAGTPGISDPGNQLIAKILEVGALSVNIVPVPGANAAVVAASISGFSMDKFVFMGFPPVKNKRKRFFQEALSSKHPVILYESPYRILKTLEELKAMDEELNIVVVRELTKKFETVYRGAIGEVTAQLKAGETRGEFVVIIKRK